MRAYSAWGATAKVAAMRAEHREMLPAEVLETKTVVAAGGGSLDLESVMKALNQDLILSHDFAGALKPPRELVDLGERELKGRNQPVRVYALASLHIAQTETVSP